LILVVILLMSYLIKWDKIVAITQPKNTNSVKSSFQINNTPEKPIIKYMPPIRICKNVPSQNANATCYIPTIKKIYVNYV